MATIVENNKILDKIIAKNLSGEDLLYEIYNGGDSYQYLLEALRGRDLKKWEQVAEYVIDKNNDFRLTNYFIRDFLDTFEVNGKLGEQNEILLIKSFKKDIDRAEREINAYGAFYSLLRSGIFKRTNSESFLYDLIERAPLDNLIYRGYSSYKLIERSERTERIIKRLNYGDFQILANHVLRNIQERQESGLELFIMEEVQKRKVKLSRASYTDIAWAALGGQYVSIYDFTTEFKANYDEMSESDRIEYLKTGYKIIIGRINEESPNYAGERKFAPLSRQRDDLNCIKKILNNLSDWAYYFLFDPYNKKDQSPLVAALLWKFALIDGQQHIFNNVILKNILKAKVDEKRLQFEMRKAFTREDIEYREEDRAIIIGKFWGPYAEIFTDLALISKRENDQVLYAFVKSLEGNRTDIAKKIVDAICNYLLTTGKGGEHFYRELLKNNIFKIFDKDLASNIINYYLEYNEYEDILIAIMPSCTNIEQFLKYLMRYSNMLQLAHVQNLSADIFRKLFLNTSLDVTKMYITDLIKAINAVDILYRDNYFWRDRVTQINKIWHEKVGNNSLLLDKEEFIGLLRSSGNIIERLLSGAKVGITPAEVKLLRNVSGKITKINNTDLILKHVDKAKENPKDPNLYKLGAEIDGFEFRVLRHLDPYAFSVGEETGCCQAPELVGEAAMIDSYINRLAGVLVVEKDDNLVSQSYFHYVPGDNGFILDNVEENEEHLKNLKMNEMDLTNLYIKFANEMKAKYPDIKYIRVGLGYNKIDNDMFEKMKDDRKDPRHFEVPKPYIDYKQHEGFIDLYHPRENIKNAKKQEKYIVKMAREFSEILERNYWRIWG